MIEIIVTCGATVGDIIHCYRDAAGHRPEFQKLMPGDARGDYGSYLLWLEPADAEAILRRHPTLARRTNGEA